MATRIKLTQGRVDGFSCPAGKDQDFLRDSEMPGLALRATAAGHKGYVYEGKLDGKTIRVTIGDPEALNLTEARDKAAEIRVMIRAGRDPRIVKAEVTAADVAKRQKARQLQEPAITAWQAYMKARANKWGAASLSVHEALCSPGGKQKSRGRKTGEGDTTLPGALHGLLQMPLSKIDSDAVEQWLVQQRHRPGVARAAFVRLRAFLNWCAGRPAYREHVIPGACTKQDVKDEVPPANAKQDALERQHLKSWFEQVRKLENPVQVAYLQTVLLTGARREEIAALKWADIDFRWHRMDIADKVDGRRIIPLTPYVAALLLDLKRLNDTPPNVRQLTRLKSKGRDWEPSEWVFSSPTAASGRIQEPRAAHDRVLTLAGLPHVSIHGLRRSFGSLSQWFDIPAGIIPQIQGHKPSATAEKHYRVRPIDLLQMWHAKYERWILEQAGIEQPTEQAQKPKAVTAA
ncbi:integrase family protein [Alcaligenaceae bacterium]|nr:integrase family protein [Alcaligenaceae bacterium]